MSLEHKVAHWMDLGLQPYHVTMCLQDELVERRQRGIIPDTILAVQHPTTVSFGRDSTNNQFSEELLLKVRSPYSNYDEQAVLEYLSGHDIGFHRTNRGGGATVFAPGQYIFYPIVDHVAITGSNMWDMQTYKEKIYRVLFDSLINLGVQGVSTGSQESYKTRNERKDIWITREGKTLKMGSKGISFKRSIAYNGFGLYIDANCVRSMELVHPCGYKPGEVKLWTVEEEIGRPIKQDEVYAAVQKALGKHFGYTHFVQDKLVEAPCL